MAQDKQSEAFSGEISSQCAHRRIMGEGCARKLRSDAQLGYAQGQSGNGQGQLGSWLGQFGFWPGGDKQEPDQRDEEQPKVHRERRKSSTPPKVAAAPPPKAKKTSTPLRLTAQEQHLYQEFLEWRNRRLFFE